MRSLRLLSAISLIGTACSSERSASGPDASASKADPVVSEPSAAKAEPVPQVSINDFFLGGAPSFIVGTTGDAIDDRRIGTQVALVQSFMPGSRIVEDNAVDLATGTSGWPERPVVYGGAHVNAVIAGLADRLPFAIDERSIRIGDRTFEGEGYRLVTVVPAGENHPEFVLFAGTGKAGIAEINASLPFDKPIVIADAFGALVQGSWARAGDRLVAELGEAARRIEYRTIERKLPGADGSSTATIAFAFPEMVPPKDTDDAIVDASMRGLTRVVERLEIAEPVSMTVYVYPDRRSKQALTRNAGDGHAVPSSRTLHVLDTSPELIESLVAHEGTHVLGYFALGPVASPLLGEGMAVWVSGQYGGRTLDGWRPDLRKVRPTELLGAGWKSLPETEAYPIAGTFFAVAVDTLGLPKVAQHLLGGTPDAWATACKDAGTTPEALDAAFEAALAR